MSLGQRRSLWYGLPDFGQIEFPYFILAHFERHQQIRRGDKEAGGQLFWEYTSKGHKRVAEITGPRPTDRRTRISYKADSKQEQIEIDNLYEEERYFLGDWHTHPESIASPSPRDLQAIQEIYNSSIDPGPGFILVIVGTLPINKSLSVSWYNGQLNPIPLARKQF